MSQENSLNLEAPQRITQVKQPVYPDIPYCDDPTWFYQHPAILKMANTPTWTLSGKTTKSEKVPLDAWEYHDHSGKLVGAQGHTPLFLMTLQQTLATFWPEIQTVKHRPLVHYLDWQTDGFVCLDIEPTCDPQLRNKFLQLPCSYGEFSLSGKGFHLLFEVPMDIFRKYPNAMKKKKMQHSSATYEILLSHYMTFTQNMLYAPQTPATLDFFYEIFEDLCKEQVYKAVQHDFQAELIPLEEIPNSESIMDRMSDVHNRKDVSDYPTMSHYEYGTISCVMHALYRILQINPWYLKAHTYSDAELAMLIYYKVIQLLEHREKHDTERNGLPYLLYCIQSCMGKNPFYANPKQDPKNQTD